MSGRTVAVLVTIMGLSVRSIAAQAPIELEGLKRLESLKSLKDLKGFDGLRGLEGLKGLEGLRSLEGLKGLEGLTLGFQAWEAPDYFEHLDGDLGDRIDGPAQQAQADSLYRAAREALNAGDYQRAAAGFQRVWERFPRSEPAADATYWHAFALSKIGGERNLQTALQLLQHQTEVYPRARTRRDGEVLATRIRGELARLGNAEAAESVFAMAAPPAPAAAPAPVVPPSPGVAPAPPAPAASPARRGGQDPACRDEDNELRAAALNALLQMDSERALPILKQVLERRDPCSVELRRKAMFLVSQKRGAEVEDILLGAVRNDPDHEVRSQGIFWLSQVRTERAVTALDSILLNATDRELQEKAIFALSEQRSPRATEILKRFVERADVSDDLKGKAIFWLGQGRSEESFRYLRELYPRLQSAELKDKVIFAIAEKREAEARQWLMDLALNAGEPMELRKKALFWAGQSRNVPIADLVRLYDTMNDREMKEQLIFGYSQRREPEAVNKLMAIAENDPDGELRKKAIFWLGQSKDPRAAEFLLRLINR